MTLKDDKLVKKAQTMTAGVTSSKLESGKDIDLHGVSTRVTFSDAVDTTVQYPNKARRTFDTHVLNSFIDLGTFPVGTEFERPTGYGMERAVIIAVTGGCCYQVRVTDDAGETGTPTWPYAFLIKWHMGDMVVTLSEDTEAADKPKTAEPEALQFGQAIIDDLRLKLEAAIKELQQQSIEHAEEKNFLQRELLETKALINKQKQMHETVVTAYEEDIKRLEAKAAIINPAPVSKEVCTLIQVLNIPEMRKASDVELAAKLSEGWSALHIGTSSEFMADLDCHVRIVTLVRDIPSSPSPKVVATDAAIYSQPTAARPPVTQPPYVNSPLPAGQVIVNLNQPVSRPLTNNVPRESKTLSNLELQKQRHADELNDIFSRGQKQQEALRREFANQPNPFVSGG